MSKCLRGKVVQGTPFVTIAVGTRRRKKRLDAIPDTGCTCALAMSRRKAQELGLTAISTTHVSGAFGNREPTTLYDGFVHDWFGARLRVVVHAPANCPDTLIGTELLVGKTISFQDDGRGNDVHIVPSEACQRAAAGKRKCPIR